MKLNRFILKGHSFRLMGLFSLPLKLIIIDLRTYTVKRGYPNFRCNKSQVTIV